MSNKELKYGIIFDMDGTLWDSAENVAISWNEVLKKHYPDKLITDDDMKSVMGKTMDVLADILFPYIPKEERYAFLDECCVYENEYLRENGGVLYPDLEKTLISLSKKYNLYIVSNCQKGYIEAFLDHYGFAKYFKDIECYGNNELSKGKNIRLVVDRNELDRAVYVGDIQGDYDSTMEAGIDFIHAAYGFGTINTEVPRISSFAEIESVVEEVFLNSEQSTKHFANFKEEKKMETSKKNIRKCAIIGCGFVGSSTAFAIMESGLFSEMVLIDADKERAEGEALDISHGVPFVKPIKIYAGDYNDIKDAAIVIITAGAAQKPGETRLMLVQKNVAIFKSIIPEIVKQDYEGILLVVSNPVDVLSYVARELSGFPANRVIGSGTVLDTARLKTELGEHLSVDPRTVHAFIIGEHGDSELAAWSSASVSGVPLSRFCEMRGHYEHDAAEDRIQEEVKNAAYEIIAKKKATYYGVAMAVRRICEAIVRDEKSIMPVSNLMRGEFGIEDVYLSMPAIVGKDGVYEQIPITLDEEETELLTNSANKLKEIIASVEI